MTCRQVEHDVVIARQQVREQVKPAHICVRRVEHIAKAIHELDRHSSHSRLTHVLQPVGVDVLPHKVTDGRPADEADVHAAVRLAARQNEAISNAGGTAGITVEALDRVIRGVLNGELVTRCDHAHPIAAWRQAGEEITTVRVGNR